MKLSAIFSCREKKEKKEKPLPAKRRLYIYRPLENAMAYRLEYRKGIGYVYPGWGKAFLYTIEENHIRPAGVEQPAYIIIGNNICNAADESPAFRISGDRVFRAGEREACYELRDSITVQGTL